MGRIHILPPDVANKIAAGEVIERPASVVKELIENSLDANADSISIEIEDGGKRLIRVTDNGEGIIREDISQLYKSHATSKITDLPDLFNIRTLGFRGEALSSIASVSHCKVSSRIKGEIEGASIFARGGETPSVSPCACPEGTIVEVRNLFFNVPARRKFLRSSDIEHEQIRQMITRYAIYYCDIRIEFANEGNLEFALPKTTDEVERITYFFDPEFARSLINVELSNEFVSLKAYLAPPQFSRATLHGHNIYLNGRFIRDRLISKAVNDAYKEVLVAGRFPIFFLFLDVNPIDLDVNVHPTKLEVRFKNIYKISELIYNNVREVLLRQELAPVINPQQIVGRQPSVGKVLTDYFSQARQEPQTAPAPQLIKTAKRYFQLHDRFIIEETEDGIRIIDQHALHERFMLEKITKQYSSSNLASQQLLVPASIKVTNEEKATIVKNRRLFESFGIRYEDFGKDTIRVDAVPAIAANVQPEQLVRDLLEGLNESVDAKVTPIEKALETLACKSAVKFGQKLSDEEILELLSCRYILENPHSCAHGRPVAIKLTFDDLEKFFKRR